MAGTGCGEKSEPAIHPPTTAATTTAPPATTAPATTTPPNQAPTVPVPKTTPWRASSLAAAVADSLSSEASV